MKMLFISIIIAMMIKRLMMTLLPLTNSICISVLYQVVTCVFQVKWRPVFWGLALQFYFALFILRSDFGYRAFEWLGNRVSEFLAHTDAGSSFVFGSQWVETEYGKTPAYEIHFFGFKVF